MPTITIHGIEFHIPAPYSPGHPCTQAECDVLNRTFAEALRNNWAKRVRAAIDADEAAVYGTPPRHVVALREEFESYASTYTIGTAKLKFGDPIEREATKIARALAQESLNAAKAAGKELKPMDSLVDAFLTSPVVQAEAARRVAAARETAAKALELFEEPTNVG